MTSEKIRHYLLKSSQARSLYAATDSQWALKAIEKLFFCLVAPSGPYFGSYVSNLIKNYFLLPPISAANCVLPRHLNPDPDPDPPPPAILLISRRAFRNSGLLRLRPKSTAYSGRRKDLCTPGTTSCKRRLLPANAAREPCAKKRLVLPEMILVPQRRSATRKQIPQ